MNSTVDIAKRLAETFHKGQTDKAGRPYINHPEYIASKVTTDEEKMTALLHDILEDTDCTALMLKTAGIPQNVIDAVITLTCTDNTDYFDYITEVKQNPLATTVKIQDLLHNMDISRIKNPTKHDYKRLEKYKKALELLIEK